jgi:hypothetical protein
MTGDEWISTLAALVVSAAIAFGILAAFPRSPRGVIWATLTILCVFAVINLFGSALVGPTSLSGMLVHGPFAIICGVIWYHWKARKQTFS